MSLPEIDPQRPLAILSAPGSRGDVNPMLAIGRGLRQAGYEVVIGLAEPYVGLAERLGLRPLSLLSRADFERLTDSPELWHPIGGPRALLGEMIPATLETHYRSIDATARPGGRRRPGPTVLVAHPLDMASRIYRDRHPELPLVSVHLAPAILRTPLDPPRMTSWWFEPRRPAAAVRTGYWMVDRLLIDRWLTPPLNRFRTSLGLPPVDRPLDRWWLSPDRVLGMYPDWFAPPAEAWPRSFRAVGFPLYDGPAAIPPNPSEADVIDPSEADVIDQTLGPFAEPPIVFTAGTAHRCGEAFFAAAAEACRRLARPGLLLTSEPERIAGLARRSSAEPSIRVAGYLPLGALLPRCAGIVHHGGIGTTSQALAAGIPQLVCPMAFDQFDNAQRIERLGSGRSLPMRRLTAARLHAELQSLLSDSAYARCAAELKRRVDPGSEAIARSVQAIVWHRDCDL
ncbi:glycosyltransferase [Candidatus Laterigemmans baculatus]|uniref:glycosyltransferase n=1 Tax=Candidatus Laterigemmans baculatus TaxID=2770505 RepID=UPI0013DB02F9|nr:nucleotide disphospho-sugar-binding domain-containing protein [Candidatus Laterigemmans baculatus]